MTAIAIIPSTNERVKGAIQNLVSLLSAHASPTDPIAQAALAEAAEAQKILSAPKSEGITSKAAKEAWEDFVRGRTRGEDPLEMFRFSELGNLPDDQKKMVIREMQKAFEAAILSDALAAAAERDAIRLFEAMGMPENVAMYLWREKDTCRRDMRFNDTEDLRDGRKHREALAIEIMRWALSPNKDEILNALAKFFNFRPECIPEEVQKDMKESAEEPPDECASCRLSKANHATKKHKFRPREPKCPPLMSESFLYPLFGKEDARTVRAYMRGILNALGIGEMEIWKRAKTNSDD